MHDFRVDRPVYVDTSNNISLKKKMPSTGTRKKKNVGLVAGTHYLFIRDWLNVILKNNFFFFRKI